MSTRSIGVVTTSRADYGICLPVLRAIEHEPSLKLRLYVTGMHLAPHLGLTVEAIEADGFAVAERIETLLAADTPQAMAKTMGLGIVGFADSFARSRPDLLVVVGDRFEMYSAAVAALGYRLPVAHIHGGEVTAGAMDEALRHSISKLSHLHFVATEQYCKRLVQLGEEPWRITVSGAPGLDNLAGLELLDRHQLDKRYGLTAGEPFLLVTFHPATLESEPVESQVQALLAALEASGMQVVFTLANADPGGSTCNNMVRRWVADRASARLINNLGTEGYFSMMRHAAAMVGNSSSGIVEAATFELPVVNIGSRQQGRVRPANVIDTGTSADEINDAISKAIAPELRSSFAGLVNPHGRGRAAETVVAVLRAVRIDDNLICKRFHDVEFELPDGADTSPGTSK